MKFLKIKSYAKINLSLNIIGKLRSKLHQIESLVTFVNLHDLIYLRPTHLNRHKVYFEGKFSKGILCPSAFKRWEKTGIPLWGRTLVS